MIELGVKQKLYIDHKTDFGVYLSDTPERNGKSDCVLLPKKQVPQNAKIGDEVEVFVYRDSKDREIATTNMPKLQLGELAVLQVAQGTGKGFTSSLQRTGCKGTKGREIFSRSLY